MYKARLPTISTEEACEVRSGPRYRWAVLAAGVVGQASYSAVLIGPATMAPVLQRVYHLGLPSLGVVLAAANAGSLLTLLAWGFVADRHGERLVLAGGLSATAIALVAAGFTRTAPALVMALLAAGALGSGVNSASGRAVMGWFAASERGLALGIRQTAVPLGGAVSALVLPSLAHGRDVESAFLFLAGACVVAAVIGAALLRDVQVDTEGVKVSLLRENRLWRLGIGSTFLVLAQISVISFVPLFLHRHRGVSLVVAGAVLATIQVLGAVARLMAGWASDRMGARVRPIRIIALCLVASLLASAVLVNAPLALLVPALVIAGTLGLSWNGLSFTATAELVGRGRTGAAIGLQQTLLSTGATVAPIAFAAVVGAASWSVAFAVSAVGPALAYAVLAPLSESAPIRPRPS